MEYASLIVSFMKGLSITNNTGIVVETLLFCATNNVCTIYSLVSAAYSDLLGHDPSSLL